jgi:predicted dehydrogenase
VTPTGVAVVGAGFWGKNLVRNFASLPDARLAYICDLDPARLEAASAIAPRAVCTSRLDDVLGDRSVDAVIVATPAESHRGVSVASLEAGKHLFVEKPIATARADAGAIIAAAASRGRVLMVGHLFMYDPAVRSCIDRVRANQIGGIRYINSVRTSMAGMARLDTNIVWDALIHDAYILTALVGRCPARVLANGQGYLSELQDVAFVTFDFGGGVLAQCYASWYALEKARRLTVVGSSGIMHLDEFADPKLAYYKRRYEQSALVDPQGRRRWEWIDEGMEPIPVDDGQPLRLECEHFLDCVRNGVQPRTSGDAALQAVDIIEACQASLAAGGSWTAVV